VKPWQWAALAVVGIVLWLVVRKRLLGTSSTTSSGSGTVNGPAPGGGGVTVGGDPRSGGTGVAAGGSSARDVAPWDLETMPDVFQADLDPNTNQAPQGWTDWFEKQVRGPAQALTPADVTAEDVKLAWALLDGTLTPQRDPNEMSVRQKRQQDLNESDAAAASLYSAWKTVANIAGSLTFGLSALAANLVDTYAGSGGVSVTDELNRRNAVDNAVQGSLSGTDMIALLKWLGPVELIGYSGPSDWDTARTQALVDMYLGKRDPAPPIAARPAAQWTDPSGVKPLFNRWSLFTSGRTGFYLRWNAEEITNGRSFRDRVNLRARIYKALDVIACQLFPWPRIYDPGIGDPPGSFTKYNLAYKGPDGKFSGWIKGSIFPPNHDATVQSLANVHQAETQVGAIAPLPPSPVNAVLPPPAPSPVIIQWPPPLPPEQGMTGASAM
jgi:hypothetical protein